MLAPRARASRALILTAARRAGGAMTYRTLHSIAVRVPAGLSRVFSGPTQPAAAAGDDPAGANQVLEWNQIFIDTLIATNTANSSSQRLGAIVHTAVFDAYNGIERRYTPVFVHATAPRGASRRAAVIASAQTVLVELFK